jgi:hypothetical protein
MEYSLVARRCTAISRPSLVKSSAKHQGRNSLYARSCSTQERITLKTNDSSPHTADYYLERAAECERLADETITQENRRVLLELAARWRGLAAEADGSPPKTG